MKLRPGLKLSSAVCDAQVVVIRAGADDVDLACGGAPMVADAADALPGGVLDESLGEGPQLGKRYTDEDTELELLCSRPGAGALTVDGRLLVLKGAKPLPSSD
jgi:hypothetical protein